MKKKTKLENEQIKKDLEHQETFRQETIQKYVHGSIK